MASASMFGRDEDERPVSQIVETLLTVDGDLPISVGEIVDRLGERAFGLVLILLAIPTLIPSLPLASGPIGILFMIGGAQMLAGRRRLWLPSRVREYRVSRRVLDALRLRGVATLRRMERFSRPRHTPFSDVALLRMMAIPTLAMGFILWLPLPLMNTLPGVAMMVIAVGILNEDGVFLLAGCVLAAAVLAIVGVFFHEAVHFLTLYGQWLAQVAADGWQWIQRLPGR
jgi:hypothetical protein